jgi:hypothetical protein
VLDAMADLDSTVQRWPAFADDLAALAKRLAAVIADGSASLAPGLIDHSKAMLRPAVESSGNAELDIAVASALEKEVANTTLSLALLPAARELQHRLADVETGSTVPLSDKRVYEEAQRKFRQALAELELAKSAADVERAGVDKLLEESRALALQLVPHVPVAKSAAAQVTRTQPIVSSLITLLPRLARTLTSGRRNVRAVDLAWLLVALAVATWTGLAALYISKPWGLWSDYIALAVWAFGATAVLTPLLSGLANVTAGALSLKKSDDKSTS